MDAPDFDQLAAWLTRTGQVLAPAPAAPDRPGDGDDQLAAWLTRTGQVLAPAPAPAAPDRPGDGDQSAPSPNGGREMESKTCTRCGQTKPLSGFHRDPSHRTGRKSHCRSCVAQERIRIKAGLPPPPSLAVLTEKACHRCGKTQPVSEFFRYVRSTDGYRNLCKRCLQISLSRGKTNLTPKETAILRALRQNGLRLYQLEGRFGDSLRTTLKDLVKFGLVQRDAQDYYELTEAGKRACPCRNPAYAKRFQAGAQASQGTPALPVKASLDTPATGEAAR